RDRTELAERSGAINAYAERIGLDERL
ncbi:MAG: hypothetical protein ACI8S6_002928, partial [Myxococcota bacterium]